MRKAVITGATSGIGLELAKRLAASHELLLTGRRRRDELPEGFPKTPNMRSRINPERMRRSRKSTAPWPVSGGTGLTWPY